MATARQIVARAFQKAHIVARGETPATEQNEAAIETLNDMLEEWRDNGVDFALGVLGLDDEVTVDGGAMRAIVYNLAVELANDEHAAIPPATAAIAERAWDRLVAREQGPEVPRFSRALTRSRYYDLNEW
jgi:hypothetical protein